MGVLFLLPVGVLFLLLFLPRVFFPSLSLFVFVATINASMSTSSLLILKMSVLTTPVSLPLSTLKISSSSRSCFFESVFDGAIDDVLGDVFDDVDVVDDVDGVGTVFANVFDATVDGVVGCHFGGDVDSIGDVVVDDVVDVDTGVDDVVDDFNGDDDFVGDVESSCSFIELFTFGLLL